MARKKKIEETPIIIDNAKSERAEETKQEKAVEVDASENERHRKFMFK